MLLNFLNRSFWNPGVHKYGDEGLKNLFSISKGLAGDTVIAIQLPTMSASLLSIGVLEQFAGEPVLIRLSA